MSKLDEINQALRSEAPAVWTALSPTARQAVYPADIPFQAAEARGTRYNATIGQITDGAGGVLQLPAVASLLAGLSDAARNRALLYSPIPGQTELRRLWRERERRQAEWDEASEARPLPPSSSPLVTSGLTHALALAADLFGGPDRAVLVPDPCWGNYRQVFALRTGARIERYPFYRDGEFWPGGVAPALARLPPGEPAVVVLNFPSNPGGYMPTRAQRSELVASLVAAAADRPVVALCDEAYASLVYDPEIPRRSLFWDLCGRSPQLIPVRASGATKEFLLFGGRIGFLTLPWDDEHPVASALDDKLRCLLRAGVGSPVALSQEILLQALQDEGLEGQVDAVRSEMARRHRSMCGALAAAEARGAPLRLLPSNSGAFVLLELSAGLDAESARRHLIEHASVGVVAVPPRYLRLAFCSTAPEDIEPLVDRLVVGLQGLEVATAGTAGA
ncbi:MAG: aminotransferase class I/II-fold pyridoxal phosphate-dependent enzyme [Acidobacteria bacterium]|nr:MAG: aminotransferase class I/II-fold pyridoxal phosphate-dependent enzyme [Acidobacteriota bacterium]REK12188.1 MAG: aminotransferase class I/II-fold pyridoxal phosphate-dependent enzyme [Acidobacteriota bacterium]